jgi:hypothetical protein
LLYREGIKSFALHEGFSIVRFHSFSRGSEFPIMHESATRVVKSPQLARNEFAVSIEESWRTCGLVKWLAFRVGLGSLVELMSCSLRLVYAGTITTPRSS